MPKIIKNTTALILLGAYLIGFYGVHLVKHDCYACGHSETHLIIEIEDEAKCSEDIIAHEFSQKKYDYLKEAPCCNYDFYWLKNTPITTKINTIAFVIDGALPTTTIFDLTPKALHISPNYCYSDNLPDSFTQVDRCKLCTFLC